MLLYCMMLAQDDFFPFQFSSVLPSSFISVPSYSLLQGISFAEMNSGKCGGEKKKLKYTDFGCCRSHKP